MAENIVINTSYFMQNCGTVIPSTAILSSSHPSQTFTFIPSLNVRLNWRLGEILQRRYYNPKWMVTIYEWMLDGKEIPNSTQQYSITLDLNYLKSIGITSGTHLLQIETSCVTGGVSVGISPKRTILSQIVEMIRNILQR